MKHIIDRHSRIALQFSGGKDSLACLYLLRPFLDRITVYWVNTGDAYPETHRCVSHAKQIAPHFVEIYGNQPKVIATFGIPSDIVPASHTLIGTVGSGVGSTARIQDRYHCCYQTIMRPMHERMLADGVTLIIRGQRGDDHLKAPITSGQVIDGVEYLFPVEGWSVRDVLLYLEAEGAPMPDYYELLPEAPDCMTCSAWWEKQEAEYRKERYPLAQKKVEHRIRIIRAAVAAHTAQLGESHGD